MTQVRTEQAQSDEFDAAVVRLNAVFEKARLSEVMEIAVREADAIDRDAVEPRGDVWLTPDWSTATKCFACLAGIAIAGASGGLVGGADHSHLYAPREEDGGNERKKVGIPVAISRAMVTLDAVRTMELFRAWAVWYGEEPATGTPAREALLAIPRRLEENEALPRENFLSMRGWDETGMLLEAVRLAIPEVRRIEDAALAGARRPATVA